MYAMLEQLLCSWCFIDDDQVQAINSRYDNFDNHPVHLKYQIGKTIGYGAFAKVCSATEVSSGQKYALKVIHKKNPKVKNKNLQVLLNERNILQQLSHPNIIKVLDCIENDKQMVLVLEHLSGGELLNHIHKIERYTEGEAAYLFQQIAGGVAHLHGHNIIHRDIKPENIMFLNKIDQTLQTKEALQLKIIDLGMACSFRDQKIRKQMACLGSPGFVAPEIIKRQMHTPAMDMFSLGVLLFIMLCGKYPMYINQAAKLMYSDFKATAFPNMKDLRFQRLSDQAKDLIYRLLQNDPVERMKSSDIMQHEWITTMGGASPRELDKRLIFRDIKNVLEARRKWRGAINGLIAVNRFWTAFRNRENRSFDTVNSNMQSRMDSHIYPMDSYIENNTATCTPQTVTPRATLRGSQEKENVNFGNETLHLEDVEQENTNGSVFEDLNQNLLKNDYNNNGNMDSELTPRNSISSSLSTPPQFVKLPPLQQKIQLSSYPQINLPTECNDVSTPLKMQSDSNLNTPNRLVGEGSFGTPQSHFSGSSYSTPKHQQMQTNQDFGFENIKAVHDDRKQDGNRISQIKKHISFQVTNPIYEEPQMQDQNRENRKFTPKGSKSFNSTLKSNNPNPNPERQSQQYLYFDELPNNQRRLMWQKGAYHLSLERVQHDIDISFYQKPEIELTSIDKTLLNNSEPVISQSVDMINSVQYDDSLYESLPARSMDTSFDLRVQSQLNFKLKRLSQSTFFTKKQMYKLQNS